MFKAQKKITLFAIIALISTSLLSQQCVISYEHGHNGNLSNSHYHIYESWSEMQADSHTIHHSHNHSNINNHNNTTHNNLNFHDKDNQCSCEESFVEVLLVKLFIELPTANLFSEKLILISNTFLRSNISFNHDIQPDLDILNRIERPPSFIA